MILFFTIGVRAEDTKYTKEQLNNSCTYLGEFCDITKKKCAIEKALDQEECFMDYVGRVLITQKKPKDQADIRNAKYANEACQKLGDECNFIQLECLSSGGAMFNSCIAMSYFKIEVAKELCGVIGYKACIERDREFGIKVIHELTLPNIDKPIKQVMWNECSHAGNYKVKSIELKRFYYSYMEAFEYMKDPIVLSKKEDYEHKIQEEYYKCMKAVLNNAS